MLNIRGFLYAMLASISFGLINLFTLPLAASGLRMDSILFYRFLLAGIAVGLFLVLKREGLATSLTNIGKIFFLGSMYAASAILYFLSFTYMPSGLAATIMYIYPVMVAAIMFLFFKERLSWVTAAAIVLAVIGVAILSTGDTIGSISATGMLIVLASGAAYALYIVGLARVRIQGVSGIKITFWIFLSASLYMLLLSLSRGEFQIINETSNLVKILLLAIITGAISNIFTILAVQNIGSTFTSIIGAVEPMTAVCVGVFVFAEPFTTRIGIGMVLVLVAVLMIVIAAERKSRK